MEGTVPIFKLTLNNRNRPYFPFENALDAEMARGRLESEGIRAFVQDGNIVGANWTLSNAVGGVKVAVLAQDLQRAIEILADAGTHEEEDSGWGKCSKCGSSKLELHSDRKMTNLTWLLLGIPLLFPNKRFLCRSCGEVMKEPMLDNQGGDGTH